MLTTLFEEFEKTASTEEITAFRDSVTERGFSCFRLLLDRFTEQLKSASDEDMGRIEGLLAKAERMFPEPVRFSPSWERIWQELRSIAAYKKHVLQTILHPDRTGEWQVILDNPQAVQEVVCYPGLTFADAAYLYAYFRPRLEKSEYIRLQKIQTLIQDTGG